MGVSIDRLRFACCSRRVWDAYFSDRVALVTGGASGVGRATVLALAGAGAITVIADVDEHGGRQVLQEAEQAGGVVRFVRTDVAREADVQALVEGLTAEFGRLDCAVNNAAIEDETAPLAECTEAAFDRIMGVNLKGVFLCMKHEIRAMEAVGGGSIVNL